MQNKSMRILLTGCNGQVGRGLRTSLAPAGNVLALDRSGLDLANPDTIRSTIRDFKPDLIVNAAAYTAVDRAESDTAAAMAVNGVAPGVLAEEARRLNALLVHYSTDYVYDGRKEGPYVETDTTNPLSVYGKTKLAGEKAIQATGAAHYILRTSWVYSANGANFMNTMLRLGRERPELRIVNDQTGAPTWATAIAEMTAGILRYAQAHPDDPRYGVYHLTASGAVSWFGFAQAIFAESERVLGLKAPRLSPITTVEYPTPAQRPANSLLDCSRLGSAFGIQPAAWEKMLAACLQEKATLEATAHPQD
jgi:dTDP-4-dehydrorhamnose reductase